MSTPWDIELYKILDLSSDGYNDKEVYDFDFTRMLKPNIILDKRLTRDITFRPQYKYSSDNGVDYVRQRWEFIVGTNGLVEQKNKYLAYYYHDGDLGPEFLIEKVVWDHSNPDHLDAAIKEQVLLRTQIADHLKAMILAVVAVNDPTLTTPEVVALTAPFYNELAVERENFIQLGSPEYSASIYAIDLETTPHQYLNYLVGPGVTLKDYIVSKT